MRRRSNWVKIGHNGLLAVSAAGMALAAGYLFIPNNTPVDPITTATTDDGQLRGSSSDLPLPDQSQTLPIDQNLLALEAGLKALDSDDFDGLRAALSKLAPESPDHQVLLWLMAMSGKSAVTTKELRAAQGQLADWPGQTQMSANVERAMTRQAWSTLELRLKLGDELPETFQAAYAISRSYKITGNTKKIRALLRPYWHDKTLSAGDEKLVLSNFAEQLTREDHEIRFFNMMARERIRSAGRLNEVLDASKLQAAWSAVIRRRGNAGQLMDALSEADQKSMAYRFMRVEHLRRHQKDDEAIEIIATLPDTAEGVINPDKWWDERRILSRHKFEEGDPKTAYTLASSQVGGSEKTQIDAAFHAGWYALRGLKDPKLAAQNFETITEKAKGDISTARGYYWLGRSLTGDDAKQAFAKAAAYGTTYYGQLASAALGQPVALAGFPVSDETFSKSPTISAVDRLMEAGHPKHARKLLLALGWHLQEPSRIRASVDHAAGVGDHYAALKIAKAAHWRGIDVGSLTHPTGAISNATALSHDDHALAYAVARQESEFNVGAVSSANARGMLQLLPATAREMARVAKLNYRADKLTTDANYNARLGTTYLSQQLDRFSGSYVLTFAAYNAGPSRAKEWIARFGDPRGKPLEEVIDWVEQIPFPETRSYVQRILENYQVYKLRLGQEASIVSDLRFGRR